LELEFQNTNERTIEDLNTLIMIKINMAKISSKLVYKDSKKTLLQMKNSLSLYKEAYNIISNLMSNMSINETLKNQFKVCEEMIHLLPMKIAKFSNF
jgi:ribosome maturation protein Sdo1